MKEKNIIIRNFPNFLTILNLLSGSIACTFAFSHNIIYAAWLIGLAAVFDFLDGMAARLLHAYSDIGKQLDSLADLVSFGLAPSFIMFQLILQSLGADSISELSEDIRVVIPFVAFLITIFSAIRLAKFNTDQNQTEHFIGLPTPANAIFFASFPLIFGNHCAIQTCIMQNTWFLAGLIIFHSYLMVSSIPFFSLKFKNLNIKENQIRYIFIGISLIFIIILQIKSIPVIIYTYLILSSTLKWNKKEELS